MKTTFFLAALLSIGVSCSEALLAGETVRISDSPSSDGFTRMVSHQTDVTDTFQDEAPQEEASEEASVLRNASWFEPPADEAYDEEEYVQFPTTYCMPQNWVRGEYLMWWSKGNQLPALVTSSPAGTPRAAAGVLPGAAILFGGGQIDNEFRNGLRVSVGHWFDPDHMTGVEVTYFGVFDDDQTGDYTASTSGLLGGGGGSPILARPFYNASLNQEDAELISFPNVVDGVIRINSSSELHSGSALYRHFWRGGCKGRIDLLQGYRYLRLREGLQIREDLVSTDPGGLVPVGTTFTVVDQFETANEFHGYECGFIAEFWHGYWSYEFLAKVALGRLHRSVGINGATITDVPPVGGAATSFGGLLALPTNGGLRSEDDFAALPELGVNLKFEPRDNVILQVGYSLVVLNDVIRTGEQIDRIVNPTQLSGGLLVGSPQPTSQFDNQTDFWLQGISFGLTFTH